MFSIVISCYLSYHVGHDHPSFCFHTQLLQNPEPIGVGLGEEIHPSREDLRMAWHGVRWPVLSGSFRWHLTRLDIEATQIQQSFLQPGLLTPCKKRKTVNSFCHTNKAEMLLGAPVVHFFHQFFIAFLFNAFKVTKRSNWKPMLESPCLSYAAKVERYTGPTLE